MPNFDNPKTIRKYDASNMLGLLESFPDQCRKAAEIGSRFALPGSLKSQFKNVVCTGLGGSAIGADIARSYLADEIAVPFIVNRNYTLPKFVDSDTLVITSSYSGNTEETLGAYKDAKAKGAQVIAITTGGELRKLADGDGYPCLVIPGGLPPRCALGYSFFPLLAVLSKSGIAPDKSKDVAAAIKMLEYLKLKVVGRAVPENRNKAKAIAKAVYGRYPVIYAAQDHIDAVATRWRGQFAENAKTISSSHVFPEMNHNEIMGWENPERLIKEFVAVILRDKDDNPRISKRMDITRTILKGEKVKTIEVISIGECLLARIFSLIYIGDFASFYLAILNKTDPTSIDRINYLKKELAKG